ncbi:hypothetical protein IQ07DRAFT_475060, partial [Pyrenochaeta sp. DS3sAY3a]
MPVQLKKDAKHLLRMVNGKRHAGDEDHEEPAYKGRPSTDKKSQNAEKNQEMDEQAINAEPLTSDDELQPPPPRPSSSSKPKPKPAVPSSQSDAELKQLPKKPARKAASIRAPARGSYQDGKGARTTLRKDENKENTKSSQPLPASSQDNAWGFDPELVQQPPLKKQRQYGWSNTAPSLANIHAPLAKNPVQKRAGALPKIKKKVSYSRKARVESEDSESDVSMMSNDELEQVLNSNPPEVQDPELRVRTVKTKPFKDQSRNSKATTLADDELDDVLKGSSKSARLREQLGDWMHDQPPKSSQPESSAPQEDLANLEGYVAQLPPDETESTLCSLCSEPVDPDHYWAFWKGKARTVKNHSLFCTSHRRLAFQAEYDREHYPRIDWDALPRRIRTHRMDLFKILTNERPSLHRTRYEPLALTGKAAAVPSRKRADLPQHIQDQLDSYTIDDHATYPGYYGARGRRVITEAVMGILANEIKNCKDPVVQASGPAAFIQAVLVPETAILLIMKDCRADREEAEEIRERTYEMGLLLNEEIEDLVEGGEESEDEGNEY